MRHRRNLLFVGVFGVIGLAALFCCTRSAAPPSDTSKILLNDLSVSDYFDRDSGVDLHQRVDYVSNLKQMDERPIKEVGARALAYRLLWLRSFHQPVCVMLIIPDHGQAFLTSRQIETEPRHSASSPYRGNFVKSKSMRLGGAEAEQMQQVFVRAGFFTLDLYDQFTRPPLLAFDIAGKHFEYGHPDIGKDGSDWVLEGFDHGRYRVLQRWYPGKDDPVKRLGIFMMTKANVLPVTAREIY